MEEDGDDIHICLSCHVMVQGLENYVTHRKYECPSRKDKQKPMNRVSFKPTVDLSEQQVDFPTTSTAVISNNSGASQEIQYDNSIQNDKEELVVEQPAQSADSSLLHHVTLPQNTQSTTPYTYDSNRPLFSPASDRYTLDMFSEVQLSKTLEYTFPVTSNASVDPNLIVNSSADSTNCYESKNITFPVTSNASVDPNLIANSSADSTNCYESKDIEKDKQPLDKENTDMPDAASVAEFFSSLELRIRDPSEKLASTCPKQTTTSSEPINVTSPHDQQKEDAFEERLKNIKIANILTNLNFSSDSEDLPSDVDELLNFSDENDDYRSCGGKWKPGGQNPPSGHTKGKWKPSGKLACYGKHGKKPGQTSGKWKPESSASESTGAKWKSGQRVLHGQGKHGKLRAYQMHKGLTDSEDEKETSPKEKIKETNGDTKSEQYCEVCKKSFKSYYYLDQHKKTMYHSRRAESADGQYKNIIQCVLCNKTLSNKNNYARHLVGEHLKECDTLEREPSIKALLMNLEPFQCRICSFCTKDSGQFELHFVSRGHVEKCKELLGPIYCKRCQVYCDVNADLLKHIKTDSHIDTVENSKRPFIVKEYRTNLTCKKCGKVLSNYSKLCNHMKSVHSVSRKKPVVQRGVVNKPNCPYCELQFRSEAVLEIHIRRKHTGEKPFSCSVCMVGFASNSDLQRHFVSGKHTEKAVEMGMTTGRQRKRKVAVNDSESIEIKKSRANNVSAEISCKYPDCTHVECGKKDMKKHYKEAHSDRNRFVCNLCNYEVNHKSHYDAHCRTKKHIILAQSSVEGGKSAVEGTWTCSICDLVFKDVHSMYKHKILHIKTSLSNQLNQVDEKYQEFVKGLPDKGTELVTCPEVDCKKRVKRKVIVEHLNCHTDNKAFRCIYCEKSFMRGERLWIHLQTHFPTVWHPCLHCSSKFRALKSLKQHMLSKHPENVDFKAAFVCLFCGYKSMTSTLMKAHMCSHAKEEDRKYQCPWPGCSKYFQYKSAMTYHVRRHTKEKPFLCDQCGFTAIDKQHLTRHKRRHTGIRNYKCEYCTYSYYNSSGLRRHMRLHINARPFKCPYQCNFMANNIEGIRKHVNYNQKHIRNGEFLYPCRHCNAGYKTQNELMCHMTQVHNIEVTTKDTNIVALHPQVLNKSEDLRSVPAGHRVHPVAEKYIAKRWKQPSSVVTETQNLSGEQRDTDETISLVAEH